MRVTASIKSSFEGDIQYKSRYPKGLLLIVSMSADSKGWLFCKPHNE